MAHLVVNKLTQVSFFIIADPFGGCCVGTLLRFWEQLVCLGVGTGRVCDLYQLYLFPGKQNEFKQAWRSSEEGWEDAD